MRPQGAPGLRGPQVATPGSTIGVEVAGNDQFVEVSTGGTDADNVPVGPGKQALVPIPNLPAGTIVVISVGKGLGRRILIVEIVEED